jgi:hypothetical protein
MKMIEYKAQYNNARKEPVDETFTVRARNISSGMRKAVAVALKSMPTDWELCALSFSQVKA